MKPQTGSPGGMRLLMWASIILLTAFLCQWLYSGYREEKDRLQQRVSLELQLLETRLADSAVLQELRHIERKGTPGPGRVIVQSEAHRTADGRLQRNVVRIDRRGPMPGQEALIRKPDAHVRHNREAAIADVLDSIVPTSIEMARGFRILLTDTIGAGGRIVDIDDSTLLRRFSQHLADQDFHFSLSWLPPTARHGLVVFKRFPEEEKQLIMAGYNPYLFRRLVPEAVFALVLLAVTATAFLVMYRSVLAEQRLSAMKNELVSNMTHELKTPIATVKVALEAMDNFRVINDPKTAADYIKMAVSEMDRLELLVQQTLNTSLMESGDMQLHPEPVMLDELIRQTLMALQPKFSAAGASVSYRQQGVNAPVMIDRLHFQGVLVNLLDNSLKYAGPQPDILVQLRQAGEVAELRISDKGNGIPSKYLDKIFDKFFRVPTGNVHNVRGYGLGLSYVRQVVTRSGGEITVGNNPDKGCTFTIKLRPA